MKKLIVRLMYFLLPLLLVGSFWEASLRKIPKDYSYKRSYLDKNSNNIEVLILGNSHSYYDINPAYIHHKTFNAAQVSQSPNIDLAMLRKYAKKLDKLKYIIIPVDYFSLFETLETGPEKWRMKNYGIYYDISFNNDVANHLEILSNPTLNIKRICNYYFDKTYTEITCSELGYGTTYLYKDRDKNLEDASKLAAKRHLAENYKYLDYNMAVLDSIIDFAKKNNIKVVFYSAPACKTYTSLLDKIQLNITIKSVTNLSRMNENVHYYNFLTDTSFSNDDFFDADHLNDIGAKKFSMKIDSLLIK